MLLVDSLSTRVTAILALGLAALLLIGAALLIWPNDDGGGVRLYQLPLPVEAQAIVEAVEASPPSTRTAVVRALDTGVIHAELATALPALMPRARQAGASDPGYQAYVQALGGRPLQIDVRRGGRLRGGPLPGRFALRLSVRLADGTVLVMQRRPPQSARHFIGRAALAGAALVGVMLLMLGLAVRQATGPVTALAREVDRFGEALDAQALPLKGPREIRQLSSAFNVMQDRIRGLMDERTRVLAAIAHDLRTYLTRLTLRAEFISDPEQREKAAADLAEMSLLLDDTLLFSGHDAGRGEAAVRIDVGAELRAMAALRREMGQAVTLEGVRGVVWAAPLALRRMLDNLIDNALRYGGSATLESGLVGDRVEIRVLDDGPGLPQAALGRLTEPFERGEASRNRETGGSGLGLAIVKALVNGQGGELILANRPEGGFQAMIRLPAAP